MLTVKKGNKLHRNPLRTIKVVEENVPLYVSNVNFFCHLYKYILGKYFEFQNSAQQKYIAGCLFFHLKQTASKSIENCQSSTKMFHYKASFCRPFLRRNLGVNQAKSP